jgi:hypothetical protein
VDGRTPTGTRTAPGRSVCRRLERHDQTRVQNNAPCFNNGRDSFCPPSCWVPGDDPLGAPAPLYGQRSGGTPATLRIDQTDASITPILPLNDNNGGQVIAYNPDDGLLYHWTGWPQANALFEKIDLETLTVTNIPLSGYQTNEIYGAAYDALTGTFLTTDVSRNLAMVTPDGVRTYVGTTDNWVRGLTFRGDVLYGGHNSLIPVNELWEIDPATGEFLTTTTVTIPGYNMASFAAMATHPDTGELWAVLLVTDFPSKKTRLLVKLDAQTGIASVVGILPELSGVSSIVFVPDPVIPVQIDVKPDDEQNAINPGSKGVIPVAIFSSADFDATSIDPGTIELAGAGVAVVGKGKSLYHEVDFNEDGLVDLLCQVETESLTLEPDAGEVWLVGETYDGQLIEGYDFIMVVPSSD